MNKSAVSLMISYVLLISIAIAVSIGVFVWLKEIVPTPPVDCKEDTSIILNSYKCNSEIVAPFNFILNLKNNGRFNIDGIILAVGNDSKKAPLTYLIPNPKGGVLEGHYYFIDALKPGEVKSAEFFNKEKVGGIEKTVNFKNISVIQIQPFILYQNKRIICQNAVIKQNIENCQIR